MSNGEEAKREVEPPNWDIIKNQPIAHGMTEQEWIERFGKDELEDTPPTSGLETYSNVTTEFINWLWEPLIPRQMVTFIDGDPGCGKTWLALKICADISNGHELPDDDMKSWQYMKPGQNCLYITCEDSPSHTIKPRLELLGANCTKIGFVKADQDGKTFDLVNMTKLEMAMEEFRPSVVMLDPIQGFIPATVDMYKANEVRPMMTRLLALAKKYDCAIICIRHLRKSSKTDKMIHRGLGSMDFNAACRSVIAVEADEEDETIKHVTHVKSNTGYIKKRFMYEVTKEGKFNWLGYSPEIEARRGRKPVSDTKYIQEAMKQLRVAGKAGLTFNTLQELAQTHGIMNHLTVKDILENRNYDIICKSMGFPKTNYYFISEYAPETDL